MSVKFGEIAESLISGGGWFFSSYSKVSEIPADWKQLCVLIDIARSLRAIRQGIECHNVREGFVAMKKAAMVLDRRLPRPKAKKKPMKPKGA